ncbi:MAG: HAD family hydrolase [Betaproteobacteria bacterium]|nr:MAG: HAD family hydrolase [Betaproteobacteria bacterium]
MSIEAVLFDADGVVQRPSVWWRQAFARLLGTTDAVRLDAFVRDFDSAERPALSVSTGFEDALASVLERWNRAGQLHEVLQILTTIEIYDDVLDAVQALRHSGMPCHLATNQQAHRARHMSEVMAYRELFDREFYSCHVGAAKPEVAYFSTILRELDLPGRSVLFLDDREENVAAANHAGLRAAVYDGSDGATALRRVLLDFGLKF